MISNERAGRNFGTTVLPLLEGEAAGRLEVPANRLLRQSGDYGRAGGVIGVGHLESFRIVIVEWERNQV